MCGVQKKDPLDAILLSQTILIIFRERPKIRIDTRKLFITFFCAFKTEVTVF